MKTQHCEL